MNIESPLQPLSELSNRLRHWLRRIWRARTLSESLGCSLIGPCWTKAVRLGLEGLCQLRKSRAGQEVFLKALIRMVNLKVGCQMVLDDCECERGPTSGVAQLAFGTALHVT